MWSGDEVARPPSTRKGFAYDPHFAYENIEIGPHYHMVLENGGTLSIKKSDAFTQPASPIQ